jgi:LPXTG-motif cell wall-anchored protein
VSPTITPAQGVLGATRSQGAALGQTKAKGVLPFTGTELTIFAIVGLALIAAGLLLRSTAKQHT